MTTRSESRRYLSSVLQGAGLLLLSSFVPATLSSQTRTSSVVQLDRNGRIDPSAIHDVRTQTAGSELTIEYHQARIFDIGGIDLPRAENLTDRNPFFVYPQDSHLLFDAPKSMIASMPPGRTSVYLFGSGRYRLRVSRLSLQQINDSIPQDTKTAWGEFVSRRVGKCYPSTDSTLIGLSTLTDQSKQSAASARVYDTASPTMRLYEISDVEFVENTSRPYVLLEIAQLLPNPAQAVIAAPDSVGCDSSAVAALRADSSAGVVQIVGASIVHIAADLTNIRAQLTQGSASSTIPMSRRQGDQGVWVATVASLSEGSLGMRVCGDLAEGAPIRRFTGPVPSLCLPGDPILLDVRPQLPSAFRLQVGAIVTNRTRDVRLAGQGVILVNRRSFYGVDPRRILGGFVNPAVGLQLGGDDPIIVMLGIHLRLIDQAGLILGLRFGDHSAGSTFQLNRALYFGFALDSSLFGGLQQTRAPAQ